MEIQISQQLGAFLASILLGLLLGLLYDLLRAVRLTRPGRRIGGLLDGLYAAVVLAALFYFALAFGDGELRIYMVIGVLGGGVLFFMLFSALLRPLWDFWRDSLITALGLLRSAVRLLLAPLRLFLRPIGKLLEKQKKLFPFPRNWFTIIVTPWRSLRTRRRKAEKEGEAHGPGKKAQAGKRKKDRRRTAGRPPSAGAAVRRGDAAVSDAVPAGRRPRRGRRAG